MIIHIGAVWLALYLFFGFASSVALAQCYFLECKEDSKSPAPAPTPAPPVWPTSPAPLPNARSYWNHNGSIMYLQANGNLREFYYLQPRPGMIAEGVTPGTLLFSGVVNGNTYQGTAYLFSARCGARKYPVAGAVQEAGGRVIMIGAATNVNSRCQIKNVKTDVLVFEYLRRD